MRKLGPSSVCDGVSHSEIPHPDFSVESFSMLPSVPRLEVS